MATVLLATGIVGVAMAGLAAGVIFSNKELKGSCGGKGGEDCVCELEKRRACHAADQLKRRQALG